MSRRSHMFGTALGRWMTAESGSDGERAEESLRRVFSMLAVPAPGPEFAAATMRRIRMLAGRRSAPLAWHWKLLIGSCLAVAGAALLVAPAIVSAVVGVVRPAWLVDIWTSALVGLSQRLVSGLAVWSVLEEIGEMVVVALASPMTMAALTAFLAIGFASCRALIGLMAMERSMGNV